MGYVKTSMTLNESCFVFVDEAAKRFGVSRSALLCWIIETYGDTLKKTMIEKSKDEMLNVLRRDCLEAHARYGRA